MGVRYFELQDLAACHPVTEGHPLLGKIHRKLMTHVTRRARAPGRYNFEEPLLTIRPRVPVVPHEILVRKYASRLRQLTGLAEAWRTLISLQ